MHLKFALVGCGRIGARHASQMAAHGELVAACDTNAARAAQIGQQYGVPVFDSLEAMLADTSAIDVLSVCTPNGWHAKHAISGLQRGCHVLCEKPLCLHVSEGEAIIAAATAAGKRLFVVKQNRYNAPVVYLKQLLHNRQLGELYSFQVNCFWNRPPAYYQDWRGDITLDGGTLYTQFSHFIDLVYWLLGDVAYVQAVGRNYAHPAIGFEDTGMVLLQMQSGTTGSLQYTVNAHDHNMEGSFTIFGEKGTIKIGGQYLNELSYFSVEGITPPLFNNDRPANQYGFYQGSMSNHDKVYENLVIALQEHDHPFAAAGDGLKTVGIIEMIYAAMKRS